MLETFYNNFGFVGSVTLSFLLFVLFIFWMAGIAGISQLEKSDKKNVRLFLSIIFPPFPIIWLFVDMYRQSKLMKDEGSQ